MKSQLYGIRHIIIYLAIIFGFLQRKVIASVADGKPDENMVDDLSNAQISLKEKDLAHSPSNLVFGYLNLFSDGVVSIDIL